MQFLERVFSLKWLSNPSREATPTKMFLCPFPVGSAITRSLVWKQTGCLKGCVPCRKWQKNALNASISHNLCHLHLNKKPTHWNGALYHTVGLPRRCSKMCRLWLPNLIRWIISWKSVSFHPKTWVGKHFCSKTGTFNSCLEHVFFFLQTKSLGF